MSLQADKTYALSEFMSLQAEQCSQVGEGLVLLRSNVIDVVLSALRVSAYVAKLMVLVILNYSTVGSFFLGRVLYDEGVSCICTM